MMRFYKLSRFVQDKSNGEWVERFESYYENMDGLRIAQEKTLKHYQTLFSDNKRYKYWMTVSRLKYNFIKCEQCGVIHLKTQWNTTCEKFLCKHCFDKPQKEYVWHGKEVKVND